MRAVFVGLGSIGRRHLKNLAAQCEKDGVELEVTALRSSERAMDFEHSALLMHEVQFVPKDNHFDVAFITNPTHLHALALQKLKGQVGAFFIEKPIFESLDYSLKNLGLGKEQKAYVAAPMRWCKTYMELKKALQSRAVYSVRSMCSSYLPNWRAGADYRKVYSAKKEMGGGVTLDLIHEWDYLTDLFGLPKQTQNLRGHFSHLEIDADDVSIYIAQYAGFLCELHLDYFGRKYRREVEVFSDGGSFVADFGAGTLTLPSGEVQDLAEDANCRYEREMEYFLRYAKGQQAESENSPARAMRVLDIAMAKEWTQGKSAK